jgi:hypothetical protein
MTLRTLLGIDAVLGFIAAVGLVLIPGPFVAPFGATLDASAAFMARGWGVTLFGFAVASWLARDAGARGRRVVGIAVAVLWIATALLFVVGIAGGIVNALAVIWIVLGAVFGAAFAVAVAGIAFRDPETPA